MLPEESDCVRFDRGLSRVELLENLLPREFQPQVPGRMEPRIDKPDREHTFGGVLFKFYGREGGKRVWRVFNRGCGTTKTSGNRSGVQKFGLSQI